tara:strand:+ start:26 stop:787 length:762 start_codon:yes stop_codon:yes gene_type:complete
MGAGTPGGPRGGFITPGGPGPGIRPPKGGDGPGIRPPKSEPTPPPRDDGRPGIRPPKPDTSEPKPPKGNKSPEIFDKLLEGIKKGGFGGQRRPIGGMSSKPAPGSDPNIVFGPDDRPIGFERPRDESDFITEFGDTRDPNYAENKRKALEEKYGRPMGPVSDALVDFPRPPRDIGLGGGPGIPPRFPTGPKDPRAIRGPRKEAVLFGGRPPSTGSKRPTKRSPKGGMSKAGPVDAETRNKFEEMLAYMKSFQR